MRTLLKVAALTAGTVGTGLALERVFASPHYQGPPSDHFDGRRFHNRHHIGARAGDDQQGSFLEWQLTRQPGFWPSWIEAEPGPRPPDRVSGGRMRVTFVNHATMLLQTAGLNILTDPIWSERCSPISFIGPRRHRAPGLRFRDLPPIDLVLISHNHYDHLDLPTLHELQRRHAPRIITPLGNGRLLSRSGVARATELDWWQAAVVGNDVQVTVVPAQHFCARAVSDRNATLWGGFVISTPAGQAYFAGDTGWGQHFDRIAERFSPIRLAMLPIGAYLPRWFMHPVHIDPSQAVEAHERLGAAASVAMHYGTFHLGDDGETQPLDDLLGAIVAKGINTFHVLEHGFGFEA